MKYEFFLDTVLAMVSDRMKDRYEVRPVQVLKNNGCRLDGLSFITPGVSLSPTVYLNGLYQLSQDGMPINELVDRVISAVEDHRAPDPFLLPDLSSSETIRDNACLRLISRDRNTEFLRDVPHIDFLDFSIIPYLYLGDFENQRMTAVLHRDHLEKVGISEDELMQFALENTVRLFPPKLNSLDEEMIFDQPDCPMPLYVLTNRWAASGATAMLYPGVLKNFADSIGEDLIILPSSIHEILLLPSSMAFHSEEIDKMIREVNETQVSPEEQLADHYYLFSRDSNTLSAPSCPEIGSQAWDVESLVTQKVA